MKVKIEVSARHIHLSKADFENLFGPDYELTKKNDLSQTGEFAANETLQIVGPKNSFATVRIIGPLRENTQVEISKTDAIFLGVQPVIKISGDIEGTPGIKLIGPKGEIEIEKGVIVAKRHLHISTQDAQEANLQNNDFIKIKVDGVRALVFENVVVRVKDSFTTAVHLDTDEANAADINIVGEGVIEL